MVPRAPRGAAPAALQQKSPAEFFAENRNIAGFDNPGKCLYTTLRELVENSLDAAEGAGVLPDVDVTVEEISEARLNDIRGIANLSRVDETLYADFETDGDRRRREAREAREAVAAARDAARSSEAERREAAEAAKGGKGAGKGAPKGKGAGKGPGMAGGRGRAKGPVEEPGVADGSGVGSAEATPAAAAAAAAAAGSGATGSDQAGPKFFIVTVKDNGCGMSHRDIPEMLGRVLSGTKYGVAQTRGKFGLGAKMALIWSKMSTGLPIQVRSCTSSSPDALVSVIALDIDIRANRPKILKDRRVPNISGWRGTEVSVTIAGNWTFYRSKVVKYLQQIAVITPYVQLRFEYRAATSGAAGSAPSSQPPGAGDARAPASRSPLPPGDEDEGPRSPSRAGAGAPPPAVAPPSKVDLTLFFARRTEAMPPPPRRVKHHPSSVDLELVKQLAAKSDAKDLVEFLTKDFSCISRELAARVVGESRVGVNGFGIRKAGGAAARPAPGDARDQPWDAPSDAAAHGRGLSDDSESPPSSPSSASSPSESSGSDFESELLTARKKRAGGGARAAPRKPAGPRGRAAGASATGGAATLRGSQGEGREEEEEEEEEDGAGKEEDSESAPSSESDEGGPARGAKGGRLGTKGRPNARAADSAPGGAKEKATKGSGAGAAGGAPPTARKVPPRELDGRGAARLHALLRSVRFPPPNGDHLSPAGEYNLRLGIDKEVSPDIVATAALEPRTHDGHAFVVEAGIAIGGRVLKPGLTVVRYANRVPLLFEAGSDVATRTAAKRVPWASYRINVAQDRIGVFVSTVSTKIPFKGAGKEYVADDVPELARAVRAALLKCTIQLKDKIRSRQEAREQSQRKRLLVRYVPDAARAVHELLAETALVRRLETAAAAGPPRAPAGAAPAREVADPFSRVGQAHARRRLRPDAELVLLDYVRGQVPRKLLEDRLREHVERHDAMLALEYASKKSAGKGAKEELHLMARFALPPAPAPASAPAPAPIRGGHLVADPVPALVPLFRLSKRLRGCVVDVGLLEPTDAAAAGAGRDRGTAPDGAAPAPSDAPGADAGGAGRLEAASSLPPPFEELGSQPPADAPGRRTSNRRRSVTSALAVPDTSDSDESVEGIEVDDD